MRHARFSDFHAFLPRSSEGGWSWRMILYLSWTKLFLKLSAESLGNFNFLTSLDSGVPIHMSWPASYFKLLWWARGFLFPNKRRGKNISWSIFSTPKNVPPCPRWRVVEISTLIGLRVPPPSNSPGDIYLWFSWFCQCYPPTSAYTFSANNYCSRRPWCNPKDNAHLRTHLKTMTRVKLFSGPKILRMHKTLCREISQVVKIALQSGNQILG